MFGLGKPRRLLYVLFALGFVGLAIGGIVKADGTVIALGFGFAIVCAALAFLAPKLSDITKGQNHAER